VIKAVDDGTTEPWAVRVAATLRLVDLAADGGSALADLATCAGADPDALGCLLRFLAARGVFEETSSALFPPGRHIPPPEHHPRLAR